MTILIDSLDELVIPENNSEYSATHVSFGIPTPKQVRVRNFSPDDWEMFVQKWAHSLNDNGSIYKIKDVVTVSVTAIV